MTSEEIAFLGIGGGAERWLILAAAAAAERIRTKIRRATELAALVGATPVDRALGLAAEAGRFADGDLESILDHIRLMGKAIRRPSRSTPAMRTTRSSRGRQPGSWSGDECPRAGPRPVRDPRPSPGRRGERRVRPLARPAAPAPSGRALTTTARPGPPAAPAPPALRPPGPAILARAREEGWDHAHLLKVLFAEEAAGRDRSTREMHRKAARLPSGKTFDAWDPKASAIPGDAQWALRTLDWIGRAENLVLVGPSGTGKSHFAEAIAHAAIDRDLRVSWFSLETLTTTIARSRIDASTGKVVERIVRSELVVVDDIGLLPAGADEAEALYRLVDAAYERRSLILTSNLHPARFDSIFPKGLATAAVDRLLHHAHVIVTEGRSHRLTEALDGRGVTPLQAADD
jgi:DNA replication protein DnaC